MNPAGNTKHTPRTKLLSSPTQAVVENGRFIAFFSKHTSTPHHGPRLKAVISAGSSEKSIFIKFGIIGILKLSIIKTADIADMMPVTAIFLIICLLFSIAVKLFFIIKNLPIRKYIEMGEDTSPKRLLLDYLLSSGLYRRLRNFTCSALSSSWALPPVWNFTNPQRYFTSRCRG